MLKAFLRQRNTSCAACLWKVSVIVTETQNFSVILPFNLDDGNYQITIVEYNNDLFLSIPASPPFGDEESKIILITTRARVESKNTQIKNTEFIYIAPSDYLKLQYVYSEDFKEDIMEIPGMA